MQHFLMKYEQGFFFLEKVFTVIFSNQVSFATGKKWHLQSAYHMYSGGRGSLVRIHDCYQTGEQCKATADGITTAEQSTGKWKRYLEKHNLWAKNCLQHEHIWLPLRGLCPSIIPLSVTIQIKATIQYFLVVVPYSAVQVSNFFYWIER